MIYLRRAKDLTLRIRILLEIKRIISAGIISHNAKLFYLLIPNSPQIKQRVQPQLAASDQGLHNLHETNG